MRQIVENIVALALCIRNNARPPLFLQDGTARATVARSGQAVLPVHAPVLSALSFMPRLYAIWQNLQDHRLGDEFAHCGEWQTHIEHETVGCISYASKSPTFAWFTCMA